MNEKRPSELILFRKTLDRLGLSIMGASSFLDVAELTVKGWVNGRRFAPKGVYAELQKLQTAQQIAVGNAYKNWQENGSPDEIQFEIAFDDEEANNMGWPCMGTQTSAISLFQLYVAPALVFADVRSSINPERYLGDFGDIPTNIIEN